MCITKQQQSGKRAGAAGESALLKSLRRGVPCFSLIIAWLASQQAMGQGKPDITWFGPGHWTVSAVAISPDGQTISGAEEAYGNSLKLWRVSDGSLIRTINADTNGFLQLTAFSPDGATVESGSGYSRSSDSD
jgi:WD40 repeat protein